MPVGFLSEAERYHFNSFLSDLDNDNPIGFFISNESDLRQIPVRGTAEITEIRPNSVEPV